MYKYITNKLCTYSKIINPKDRMTKVIFSDIPVTHLQNSKKKIYFLQLLGQVVKILIN